MGEGLSLPHYLEKEKRAAIIRDAAVIGKLLCLSSKCLFSAMLSHSKERPDHSGLPFFFFFLIPWDESPYQGEDGF